MANDTDHGPWAVYDGNEDPARRIAVGGSRDCAEDLRKLYLHVTPDVDPNFVHVAPADL